MLRLGAVTPICREIISELCAIRQHRVLGEITVAIVEHGVTESLIAGLAFASLAFADSAHILCQGRVQSLAFADSVYAPCAKDVCNVVFF